MIPSPPSPPTPQPAPPMPTAAVDLTVELCGVRLSNPFVLASGILGTHASLMHRAALNGAGAITAKSCGPAPRGGHVNPSCVAFGHGLLNAIGLANPGAVDEVALLVATKALLAPLRIPLIASIFADDVEGFARVATTVAAAAPDLLEVNISCPNVASEFGEPFAASADAAAAVTAAVRAAVDMPVIIKLAPNVADLARIAQAVVAAGADAICAINTMPGLLIDAESGRPVLANRTGGLSGAALKPIALYAVDVIARAVSVPIIGTGGIETALDAVEMLSAGATAVGIGSAVYGAGPAVFGTIAADLGRWLDARGLTLTDVRGRAQQRTAWPEAATPAPVPHAAAEGVTR
ncbi:MAG: dihydroorotate dehydrogenase [Ardenticatenales bacterium]